MLANANGLSNLLSTSLPRKMWYCTHWVSDSLSVRDLSCDRDAKTSNIASCAACKRVKDFLEANADGLKQEIADQETPRPAILTGDAVTHEPGPTEPPTESGAFRGIEVI